MKDVTLDREYSFKSQRLHAETSPSIPFAENLFRKFQWNRDSIMLNAPEGSGVYGLFSALWIYIGEAENMRERLLEHLSGNNSCTTHYQPSGFALSLSRPQIGVVASKSSSRDYNRCAMEKLAHSGLIDEVTQILGFEIWISRRATARAARRECDLWVRFRR